MKPFLSLVISPLASVLVLTATSCTHSRPATIYFATRGTVPTRTIQRIPVEGGDPVVISKILAYSLAFDRSGEGLLFSFLGVRAMHLDGTGEKVLARSYESKRLAINEVRGQVYWIESTRDGERYISRIDLPDGGNRTVVVGGGRKPKDFAVDSRRNLLYWTQDSGGPDSPRGIWRSKLDGSEAERLIDPLTSPRAIAVDGRSGRIYWTVRAHTGTEIHVAERDGSGSRALVGGLAPTVEDFVFDTPSRKLYWADRESGAAPDRLSRIQRCNPDGSNVETVHEVRSNEIFFEAIALGDAPDRGGK